LFLTQGGGLTLQEGLQGAFGQTGGRGLSDLFHGVEVDVEPRTVVAEGPTSDDFSPLGSELAEFVEFLRGEWTAGHEMSCLAVTAKLDRGFAPRRFTEPHFARQSRS
jgi:hypothetical protein